MSNEGAQAMGKDPRKSASDTGALGITDNHHEEPNFQPLSAKVVSDSQSASPPSPAEKTANKKIGKRSRNPWVQQAYTQLEQLNIDAAWLKATDPINARENSEQEGLRILDQGIDEQLKEGKKVLEDRGWRSGSAGSVAVGSALTRIHAAGELLLRRGTDEYIRGQLPTIHSNARKHLSANNPQRIRLEKILQELAAQEPSRQIAAAEAPQGRRRQKTAGTTRTTAKTTPIDAETRENLVAVSTAAHLAYRREYLQLRSFRNVLTVSTLLLILIAISLGIWGYLQPKEISLCFLPQELNKLVCPTAETPFPAPTSPPGEDIDNAIKDAAQPIDIFLVQFLGLIAAAVSGAASLRHVSGTSTPYGLTVALAVIKLPTGALTAVLGLMLMRGGFIPGLTALDSSAQILAWAIIFGAAQQLVTGLVDRQAQGVLDNVGGKPHEANQRPATT